MFYKVSTGHHFFFASFYGVSFSVLKTCLASLIRIILLGKVLNVHLTMMTALTYGLMTLWLGLNELCSHTWDSAIRSYSVTIKVGLEYE